MAAWWLLTKAALAHWVDTLMAGAYFAAPEMALATQFPLQLGAANPRD
jgi:hypothetical protein